MVQHIRAPEGERRSVYLGKALEQSCPPPPARFPLHLHPRLPCRSLDLLISQETKREPVEHKFIFITHVCWRVLHFPSWEAMVTRTKHPSSTDGSGLPCGCLILQPSAAPSPHARGGLFSEVIIGLRHFPTYEPFKGLRPLKKKVYIF